MRTRILLTSLFLSLTLIGGCETDEETTNGPGATVQFAGNWVIGNWNFTENSCELNSPDLGCFTATQTGNSVSFNGDTYTVSGSTATTTSTITVEGTTSTATGVLSRPSDTQMRIAITLTQTGNVNCTTSAFAIATLLQGDCPQ